MAFDNFVRYIIVLFVHEKSTIKEAKGVYDVLLGDHDILHCRMFRKLSCPPSLVLDIKGTKKPSFKIPAHT